MRLEPQVRSSKQVLDLGCAPKYVRFFKVPMAAILIEAAPDALGMVFGSFSFFLNCERCILFWVRTKNCPLFDPDVVGHDSQPCHQNSKFFGNCVRRPPAWLSSMIAFACALKDFGVWFSFME
jgi:hypothetical protein